MNPLIGKKKLKMGHRSIGFYSTRNIHPLSQMTFLIKIGNKTSKNKHTHTKKKTQNIFYSYENRLGFN